MTKFNDAFWKWFGNSKVVDSKGNPLVVYHATSKKFNVFDPSKCDLGCHFGTKKQAENVVEDLGLKNIYSVYIRIENPFRMEDHEHWEPDYLAEREQLPMEIHEEIVKKRVDRYALRKLFEDYGFDGIVYLNRYEGIKKMSFSDAENLSDSEYILHHPEARDSFIVWRPDQIKSAKDNDGTWDNDDPDIRSNPRRRR